MPIQIYFEFDVIGEHGFQIPKGKEEYFFVLNTRNPYIRMISIYHLFCEHSNSTPNDFNSWIRQKLYEEKKFPGKTLDYEYFIKKKITKTPDLLIRVESLYSDILKLPFFMDNSD
jgi:uncharacterized protein YozE (UPF0346 family)